MLGIVHADTHHLQVYRLLLGQLMLSRIGAAEVQAYAVDCIMNSSCQLTLWNWCQSLNMVCGYLADPVVDVARSKHWVL